MTSPCPCGYGACATLHEFVANLCTVHIYHGEDSGIALQRRIAEIRFNGMSE